MNLIIDEKIIKRNAKIGQVCDNCQSGNLGRSECISLFKDQNYLVFRLAPSWLVSSFHKLEFISPIVGGANLAQMKISSSFERAWINTTAFTIIKPLLPTF